MTVELLFRHGVSAHLLITVGAINDLIVRAVGKAGAGNFIFLYRLSRGVPVTSAA